MITLGLFFGLAAAGFALVVWKIVGDTFNRPDLLLVPPLGCRLCSSWWASLGFCVYGLVVGSLEATDFAPCLFSAVAVSMLVLTAKSKLD